MNFRKLCVCAALVLPMTAFANKSLHDQFSGQGYGTAGCGLGSIVFGDKPGIVQIFASTTNDTFGTQTFGITSGTSNCEDSKSRTALVPFIRSNKAQLENDAAKGSGESLASLGSLMGCKGSDVLSQNLQQNFETVFASDQSAQQLTDSILNSAQSNDELRRSCQIFTGA